MRHRFGTTKLTDFGSSGPEADTVRGTDGFTPEYMPEEVSGHACTHARTHALAHIISMPIPPKHPRIHVLFALSRPATSIIQHASRVRCSSHRPACTDSINIAVNRGVPRRLSLQAFTLQGPGNGKPCKAWDVYAFGLMLLLMRHHPDADLDLPRPLLEAAMKLKVEWLTKKYDAASAQQQYEAVEGNTGPACYDFHDANNVQIRVRPPCHGINITNANVGTFPSPVLDNVTSTCLGNCTQRPTTQDVIDRLEPLAAADAAAAAAAAAARG